MSWFKRLISADYRAGYKRGAQDIVKLANKLSYEAYWSWSSVDHETSGMASFPQRKVDVEDLEAVVKEHER